MRALSKKREDTQLRGNLFLRRLDAWIGRILVWGLALFKRKRVFPNTINEIGLLKLSGIGDLVLLSGIIRDLRQAHPHTKLSLFCGTDNAAFAGLIPSLDRVIILPLQTPLKALSLLRKHTPTVMIDFGQWSRIDPLLAYGSGCPYLIGFKTAGQHRHFLYDAIQLHNPKVHEIDNFRSLTEKLGLKSTAQPSLQLYPEMSSETLPSKRYFLLHPWPSGIRSELKEWPLSSWIELGTFLASREYAILVSGSQKDHMRSQFLVDQINLVSKTSLAINIAGKYSLNALGQYMQAATGIVSVNTGIMHMAACFPVPLIALHGPTSIKRWGPLSPHAIALGPSDLSGGYLNLGFEYPKKAPKCMELISVEQVLKALKLL